MINAIIAAKHKLITTHIATNGASLEKALSFNNEGNIQYSPFSHLFPLYSILQVHSPFEMLVPPFKHELAGVIAELHFVLKI